MNMVEVQMGSLLLHPTYIAHLPSINTEYKLRIKRETERVCRRNERQNTRDGWREACSRVLVASHNFGIRSVLIFVLTLF
jgi:hypothetical protein